MKKSFTIAALGLALAAGMATAQAPQPGTRGDTAKAGERGRGHQGGFDRRGGRGGERGMQGRAYGRIFQGITLTDAQRQQIQAIRQSGRPTEAQRQEGRRALEQVRAARQRGDTAAARAQAQQVQARMTAQRDAELAQIRNVLTAEQRVVFDRNVAEMKTRMAQRAQQGYRDDRGGERGRGRGRGGRGA